ncbi:MAG: alkaline phosphatase family protein [Gemmataceae bacterium]|nr:alkaline phosphatase family protein [Gemmataceae bacterium]
MRYVYPVIVLTLGLLALAAINLADRSKAPPAKEFAEMRAPKGTPKLVVLAVFDQMKAEYLEKWDHLFCEGGFKRLKREGAWFANCHYPYAYTLTGPGHASIATGCSPNAHGIIANDWYDRRDGDINCIDPPTGERRGKGPYRRKQESFADALVNHRMRARVFSLSIKDRAAILLAALRSQLCVWLEPKRGNFVTSDYYGDGRLPRWLKAFNKDRLNGADRWFGKNWDRYLSDVTIYEKNAGPDDVPEEGFGFNQGRTFPHPFVPDEKLGLEGYYEATVCSPAAGDLLLDLALKAIDAEKIGQGATTDLLTLGFSQNDYVGHCWGPDSQEVLDVTLKSDALMKRLLDALDAKVGKGNYVVAVTADHGVCRIPELAAKQGKKAGRVQPELFTSKAEAFLNEKFVGKTGRLPWVERTKKANAWVYLNQAVIKERKLDPATVEQALAEWLAKDPRVLAAYGKTQLASGKLDELGEKVRLSYHPNGVGDVMVVLKPYHILSGPVTAKKIDSFRTTHGMPHEYDTHVPFIVMGPGVVPGKHADAIAPQAMAATLSHLLRVPAPAGAAFSAPKHLFSK